MRRFAGAYEVFFVESLPMRSVAVGDRQELRRIWTKLRGRVGVRTVADHLHVVTPPPIPPSGPAGRWAQLLGVRATIAAARRRTGVPRPAVSWFSVPVAAPLRGRLGDRGSLFFYQDRYDEFSHVDAPRLRRQVAQLARGCDVTIATSDELGADLRALGAEPVVVGHGVDVDRFAGDPPPPVDVGSLERPLVGYVGIVDDYLSGEMIRAVADRLAHGTVVLVGSANIATASLRHPRIRLLGFRPYDSIPAYLAAFDCCILPFELNRLTLAVDPIKLREYLAAGRPVVSTPLPAVTRFSDVVSFAHQADGFADAVQRALDPCSDSDAERARRRTRVAGESWDAVAQRIRPFLDALANGVPAVASGMMTS